MLCHPKNIISNNIINSCWGDLTDVSAKKTQSALCAHIKPPVTTTLISKCTNKSFFITDLSISLEYLYEEAIYHSVRKRKVLPLHSLDGLSDIIWQSYMSMKVAKRANI